MTARDARRVHVRGPDGRLLFTRLLDDGADHMAFAEGSGWVSRREIEALGHTVHDGWPLTFAHAVALGLVAHRCVGSCFAALCPDRLAYEARGADPTEAAS